MTSHVNETDERSVLTVPATPKYARVVRMLAANLATIEGMNVEEVEDIRMAAEEAFVYACSSGISGDIEITYSLSSNSITIDVPLGPTDPTEDDSEENALAYAVFILEATCDVVERKEEPYPYLHLEKYREDGGVSDK